MIHAKNNESLSKFVNVIHKILPAPVDTCFSTTGTFFRTRLDVKKRQGSDQSRCWPQIHSKFGWVRWLRITYLA